MLRRFGLNCSSWFRHWRSFYARNSVFSWTPPQRRVNGHFVKRRRAVATRLALVASRRVSRSHAGAYPESVKEFRRSWEDAGECPRTQEKECRARKPPLKKSDVEPPHRATAGADAPGRARETRTRNHTATMTDKILKNLVTEAVSLDREINEKANQLKELKAQLVAEARGRDSELASDRRRR